MPRNPNCAKGHRNINTCVYYGCCPPMSGGLKRNQLTKSKSTDKVVSKKKQAMGKAMAGNLTAPRFTSKRRPCRSTSTRRRCSPSTRRGRSPSTRRRRSPKA
jgi:hypothetical protein